jgi:hypothetical protein
MPGGHTRNGIRIKQGTQALAYDIKREPLFNVQSAVATALYEDVDDDEDTKAEDDSSADPDAEVEDVVVARTTTATQKRISKTTTCYTTKEDVCLCRSWIAIIQDTVCGAEQKGKEYWKRVTVNFYERRQLKPFRINSVCSQLSIQKRWSFIQI